MPHTHALPFVIKRTTDEVFGKTMSATTETAHGLLRIEGDTLVVQWRVARKVESFSLDSLSTDEEMEDVREVRIPLHQVAGAYVRQRWWEVLGKPKLVLRAADLQAFEPLTGEEGLKLAHPAEIVLPIRRTHRLAAEEFAAELELAVAQLDSGDAGRALTSGPEPAAVTDGRTAREAGTGGQAPGATANICAVVVTVKAPPELLPTLAAHARAGLERFPRYEGYLGGALHTGPDERFVQYLRWADEASYRACVEDPAWEALPTYGPFMDAVRSGRADVEVGVYSVGATSEGG